MVSARDVHALGRGLRRTVWDVAEVVTGRPVTIVALIAAGAAGMAWGRRLSG